MYERLAIRQIQLDKLPPPTSLQQAVRIAVLKLPPFLFGGLSEHALQLARSRSGYRHGLDLSVLRSSEVPVHVAEHWHGVEFGKGLSDLILDLVDLGQERARFVLGQQQGVGNVLNRDNLWMCIDFRLSSRTFSFVAADSRGGEPHREPWADSDHLPS